MWQREPEVVGLHPAVYRISPLNDDSWQIAFMEALDPGIQEQGSDIVVCEPKSRCNHHRADKCYDDFHGLAERFRPATPRH
jgi:hypothetical protein